MSSIEKVEDVWMKIDIRPEDVCEDVCKFLDVSTTSLGRATHYNTREKQLKAEEDVHANLFRASRDLYQVLLALPGTTDRARQLGIAAILGNQRCGNLFLDETIERKILEYFISELPPQRMLKLFDSFRGVGNEFGARKSNSSKVKKLILRTILNSPRFELWVIKYRSKLKRILTHAWGQRLSSSIGFISSKKIRNDKEKSILRRHVFKYIKGTSINLPLQGSVLDRFDKVCTCIAFLYGERDNIGSHMKLLRSFIDSRYDLSAGLRLPSEVIEGIRSTYHKDISASELLRMRADSGQIRTRNEKKVVQKRALAVGAKVDMDPLQYDAVDLYIYAFEVGANAEILAALDSKASIAAKLLPIVFDKIAIIVDASKSMEGSKEQPMRPLATALSIRDMLQKASSESRTLYCGGFVECNDGYVRPSDLPVRPGFENELKIIRPSHETSLAQLLLDSFVYEPDAIYVISDGYENSPAGRFGDVLRKAREIGIDVPVIHCNPVFAAEAKSVRALCDGVSKMTTLPVRSPTSMGSGMLRGMIEADPRQGLNAILKMAFLGQSSLFGLIER